VVSRGEVLRRFARDDGVSVRGILRDLVDSGLVFVTGQGDDKAYRALQQDEVATQLGRNQDALVWAIIYRSGPLSLTTLREQTRLEVAELDATLQRLVDAGRLQCEAAESGALYRAQRFVIEREASLGWEAAVYDHFHAVVSTICARLDPDTAREAHHKHIGGSTYSLDIGSDHPLRERVLNNLERMRTELSELRRLVNEHNELHPLPDTGERVVIYTGQCVLPRSATEET
jgi:predicted transcriptional regulator